MCGCRSAAIGLAILGEDGDHVVDNTFTDSDIGLFVSVAQAAVIDGNTLTGGQVAMLLANVGGALIRDNTVTGAYAGVIAVASEPGDEVPGDAPTEAEKILGLAFDGDAGDAALAWIHGAQNIVEIDHTTIYRSPVTGARSVWTGNRVSDNLFGMLFFGAVNANEIGGTAPGQGNVIVGNAAMGLALAGEQTPQDVTIRGNVVHANGTAGADEVPAGVPDLKLYPAVDDVTGLHAPLVNDTGDADTGANGLQNHPVLASVAADGSSVTGELSSTPSGTGPRRRRAGPHPWRHRHH